MMVMPGFDLAFAVVTGFRSVLETFNTKTLIRAITQACRDGQRYL